MSSQYLQKLFKDSIYFKSIPYHKLMKERILEVLILCSRYEAFTLEEDGRIEEQIFNQYMKMNLRYPPRFTLVYSLEEAQKLLDDKHFDLIITMLDVGNYDVIDIAKNIKKRYSRSAVVLLTSPSRENNLNLAKLQIGKIDYAFLWMGNANICLAIIKLIEDRRNAWNDVMHACVFVVLVVESSVRYYSTYLPILYEALVNHAQEVMSENLNAPQKNLNLRARPKILLARNYEEAEQYYENYKENLLGIISSFGCNRNGEFDKEAGFNFVKKVKNERNDLPVLMQSAFEEKQSIAYEYECDFIHKFSKNMITKLRTFARNQLGFGDFLFKTLNSNHILARASNFSEFSKEILKVDLESINYHAQRNHFSKWLRNRGYHTLASYLKDFKSSDFANAEEIREFLAVTFKHYRKFTSRGTIVQFDREKFDEYAICSRIGTGSLGGKGRGLAFIDNILNKQKIIYKYQNIAISIPQTVVLSTSVFDDFMERNNLYNFALSDHQDSEILHKFLKGSFPDEVVEDLKKVLCVFHLPVVIRSSSLLEDSQFHPFAGIYSTRIIPNSAHDFSKRLSDLLNAIKGVFASTFYKTSKEYMTATGNLVSEEKMAVIIQQLTGKAYGDRFYPTFSGVAKSINFYPINEEKVQDGTVSIAVGLGKKVVDNEDCLKFCPKYPKNIIQLSSVDYALKQTQKEFYALNYAPDSYIADQDESANILSLNIYEAAKDKSITSVASTYDHQNHIIKDNFYYQGPKIITFSHLLNREVFPLTKILNELLTIARKSINQEVEIEFSVNLDEFNKEHIFNVLQLRPVVVGSEQNEVKISDIPAEKILISSSKAMGNGVITGIKDLIYIKPDSFETTKTKEISDNIEKLNKKLVLKNQNYILVGPGRWGTSDPFLGIPVKWPQISGARVIIEATKENFMVEPSQGSHFFQNLTAFSVAYFTVNAFKGEEKYDLSFLKKQKAVYEDQYIRHLRFKNDLVIKSDGRSSKGVILKPE